MENIKVEEIEVRNCDVCNKIMLEGYCIDNGFAYYCSVECMEKNGLPFKEFEELYDCGDSYWTEWYDEYTDEELEEIAKMRGIGTRNCTCCNEEMYDGFVIEDGQYYYCNEECMKKDGLITWEEYVESYDDGDGNSYWTESFSV